MLLPGIIYFCTLILYGSLCDKKILNLNSGQLKETLSRIMDKTQQAEDAESENIDPDDEIGTSL